MPVQIEGCALEVVQGDITQEQTEAIVNAANSSLLGGGGVDGAIHRAGGPAILEECRQIRAERGRLPTGQAVITGGGRLPAKWVIHTVGPVWRGGDAGEEGLLRSCYRSCLELARQHQIISLAFPSVSTGAYGYPVERAAPVALDAVLAELTEHPGQLQRVRFVLFDDKTLRHYEEALAEVASTSPSSRG